jgi:hypothetical protein
MTTHFEVFHPATPEAAMTFSLATSITLALDFYAEAQRVPLAEVQWRWVA